MTQAEILHEIRNTNKIKLQSFFQELENNSFDKISDEIITIQENKIKNLKSKLSKNINLSNENFYDDDWEIIFLKQELKALAEMRILYIFKNFEIKLKLLISNSYKDANSRKMYKWDFVVDYLKTKQIILKSLASYKEIIELKELSNTLKHSNNIIGDNTKNIIEFKNKTHIQANELLEFYERIKNAPTNFISSLSIIIYKNLYEFDEERIEKIAVNISLKMDKDDVKILIDKLQSKY